MNLGQVRSIIAQPDVPTGDPFLDARYIEQVSIIGHVNPYYRTFYRLAREFRPRLSVELGSWQATAAAHIASANPDGYVITIDVHKDDRDAQRRTIEAANHYLNLQYINGWSWDVVQQVRDLGLEIDLLYVDSWHDYQYAIRDWNDYSPMLSEGALVICDDILPDDPSIGNDMFRFWDEVSRGRGFLDATIHPGIPMGFLVYSK